MKRKTNVKVIDRNNESIANVLIKNQSIEKVLLNPRVLESLCLAYANIEITLKKYQEIDVYQDILKETLEDLDKVIFLIKQLKEGYLK